MKNNLNMNYRHLLISGVLLMSILALNAQTVTDSKILKKGFKVGNNPVLDISNKYGNIHISHTNRDSVTIKVEITATSSNEQRLRGMMSDVEVSMTLTNETVRAQTLFGKNVITLFESFKGLTKNIINFESRLQINYYVECPSATRIRISNSYGDVYIGEETPELTLYLSNGSLDIDVVRNVPSMDLTFCKADIRTIEKGKVSVSFGELRAREAYNIDLVGRSSKIWIEKAIDLDLDSKRDDITLGAVRVITGTTYFSEITVNHLTGELGLMAKYGGISCEKVEDGFTLIDINSSYTDIDLSMEEGSSYNIEIRHTNAFVSLPGVKPVPEQTEISAENKVYLTTGNVGSSHGKSRIRIDATKGEVRLLQK